MGTAACPTCDRPLPESGTCAHCQTQQFKDDGPAPGARRLPLITGYRMLRHLGEGGMGAVYLAEDEALGRTVAIKMISGKLAQDADAIGRFRREARAMATVSHPHVVHVHALGEVEGSAYIVMEHVEGENLAQRIRRRGPLPVDDALRITRQVAEALEAAWEKKIIHRDIKPSNILLDRKGQVRVADFGLAKPLELAAGDMALTQSGHLLGTPHYMSPEQARGLALDFRSDIYSLGIVLYELLAGEPPFEGSTPFSLVDKHLHERLPSIEGKRSDVLPGVADLLTDMTMKDPSDRPESYAGLLARIEGLMRPSARAIDAVTPPPEPTPAPLRVPPEAIEPRGQRAWIAWASGLAVMMMVAILVMVPRKGSRGAPPAEDTIAEGSVQKRKAEAQPAAAPPAAASPDAVGGLRAEKANARPGELSVEADRGAGVTPGILEAQAGAAEGPQLAVMSIDNVTGDPALQKAAIGKILSDAFVQILNDAQGIRVVSPVRMDSVLRMSGKTFADTGNDLALAREVCRQTNANLLLVGSLSKLGQAFVLNASLTEFPSEKLLGSYQAKVKSEDDLLDVLTSQIASQFKATLEEMYGAKLRMGRDVSQIATTNVEAYARYVAGVDLIAEGKFDDAVGELEKAVALDPKMALAWSELACAHSFAGNGPPAKVAQKMCETLTDRLSEKERAWVACNTLWVDGNRGDAFIACQKEFARKYTDDRQAYFYIGLAQRWLNHSCEAALPWYEQAFEITPTYYPISKELAECHKELGHLDRAVAALERYLKIARHGHGHDQAQVLLAGLKGS